MDYELYQEFFEWVGKNPLIGALTILGIIAAIAALVILSGKVDEWELRRRYRK